MYPDFLLLSTYGLRHLYRCTSFFNIYPILYPILFPSYTILYLIYPILSSYTLSYTFPYPILYRILTHPISYIFFASYLQAYSTPFILAPAGGFSGPPTLPCGPSAHADQIMKFSLPIEILLTFDV